MVVLYSMSVAGVRVVEFGTYSEEDVSPPQATRRFGERRVSSPVGGP